MPTHGTFGLICPTHRKHLGSTGKVSLGGTRIVFRSRCRLLPRDTDMAMLRSAGECWRTTLLHLRSLILPRTGGYSSDAFRLTRRPDARNTHPDVQHQLRREGGRDGRSKGRDSDPFETDMHKHRHHIYISHSSDTHTFEQQLRKHKHMHVTTYARGVCTRCVCLHTTRAHACM